MCGISFTFISNFCFTWYGMSFQGSFFLQNSGEIMYIDNRNVIARASDQVQSLYVVVEF